MFNLASSLQMSGKVFFVAFLFFINSCSTRKDSVELYTDVTNIYSEIRNNLDQNKPGYGISDYGDNAIADIPKAYAMFLSAELMKYKAKNQQYNLSMAVKAGNWLLENADLNKNGVIGWGVPIEWDAFGDKSIDEKNTEYTIATGIVINSLLDWIELAPNQAPINQIIQMINNAISPYLKNQIYSDSGLFNYSLKIEDRKYNCFNAAIYMAGQMQRFSNFIKGREENFEFNKSKIRLSADRVMSAAIKHKKIDANGNWYWPYSLEQKNIPNDLTHAGYIIDGIYTYINNGGTLKKLFNKDKVFKHLRLFSNNDGTEWYFYPSTFNFKDKPIAPRLYGVGFTLYLLAKYTDDKTKILHLINFSRNFKTEQSYSRWIGEKIYVTEYLTYFMYGLAAFEASDDLRTSVLLRKNNEHIREITKLIKDTSFLDRSVIPLTDFKKQEIDFKFSLKTNSTIIVFNGKEINLNRFKSVPVKLLETGEMYIVLLRKLLTNHLLVATIDKSNYKIHYHEIDNNQNSFLDFRNAIVSKGNLVVVAYENIKEKNSIFAFSIDDNFNKKHEVELPSLEDPAGRHYEVIPKILLLKDKKDYRKIHIIGGRTYVEYTVGGGDLKKLKIPSEIAVFYEALLTDENELISIVKNRDSTFKIYNLLKQEYSFEAPSGEVLFGLDYFRDSIQYRVLKSKNDLTELFIKDFLNNKGSGTLYLGTNNIEGWSAWSQVYYLNGMLSFLELCIKDLNFYNVFKDYVEPVKQRLDLEMHLLTYQYNSSERLKVRAFSVDRSLSTFAVQSSRFAMLYKRYLNFVNSSYIDKAFKSIKASVLNLKDHMESLESGISKVVLEKWNRSKSFYLIWPKGNAFYYDGLPVPYNHQNEWATFLLDNGKQSTGLSIIDLFVNHITNDKKNKNLPKNGIWPYWWGKAWDGYTKSEEISKNTPEYKGDKGNGWISFRSIDSIAMLKFFKIKKDYKYIKDIKTFIRQGDLYPFVSKELIEINSLPLMNKAVTAEHIRFSSPWKFDNTVWAYLSFIKGCSQKELQNTWKSR